MHHRPQGSAGSSWRLEHTESVQIAKGDLLGSDRIRLGNAGLHNKERWRLRLEYNGSVTRIMERKLPMPPAVGTLVIGIREMQEQETSPGHAASGLHHMLLIVIAHGRCTQQLEHTTGCERRKEQVYDDQVCTEGSHQWQINGTARGKGLTIVAIRRTGGYPSPRLFNRYMDVHGQTPGSQ